MTKRRILCYGDSNTWGYDAVTGDRFDENIRYPKALQTLLGEAYEVVEEGCGGRTTAYHTDVDFYVNGLSYFYPCLESHNPLDLVVIMLGTNDLNNGVRINAYYAAAGVERLVNEVRHWSIDKGKTCPAILVVSPPLIGEHHTSSILEPVFDYPWAAAESRKFRTYYAEIAKKTGCAFLAAEDYTSPCQTDGVHLDAPSHLALAKALCQTIRQLLPEP